MLSGILIAYGVKRVYGVSPNQMWFVFCDVNSSGMPLLAEELITKTSELSKAGCPNLEIIRSTSL